MQPAKTILDHQYLEMRWRLLSLAADFDRIDRAAGQGKAFDDPRLADLRHGLEIILRLRGNRAEQLQMLLSDRTPGPHTRDRHPGAVSE